MADDNRITGTFCRSHEQGRGTIRLAGVAENDLDEDDFVFYEASGDDGVSG